MKSIFLALSSVIMAAYVVYRCFTTLVILPFAEPLMSRSGIYFLLLVLLAAGATALSFTPRIGMAASLASVVGIMALCFWLFVICTAPWRTWSNFVWFVVPEVCFSLAALCKWWVGRSGPLFEERRASQQIEG
jgi:hypothetical protein